MRLKRLAFPIYLTAAIMMLFPLLDTFFPLFPLRLGEVAWRINALGLMSRNLLTPVVGLLLAMVAAVALDHRKGQRVLAILAGIASVLLVVALGLFVLDAAQLSSQAPDKGRMLVVSAEAFMKFSLFIAATGAISLAGWRAAKAGGTSEHSGSAVPESRVLVPPASPARGRG